MVEAKPRALHTIDKHPGAPGLFLGCELASDGFWFVFEGGGAVCVGGADFTEWSLCAGACCAKHDPTARIWMGLARRCARRHFFLTVESGEQWRGWGGCYELSWTVREASEQGCAEQVQLHAS